jgi:hypothetical protein
MAINEMFINVKTNLVIWFVDEKMSFCTIDDGEIDNIIEIVEQQIAMVKGYA